jgi:spore coat protein A
MKELRVKVHRDVNPTRFWSFGNTFPGPTIEVQTGQPIMVEWANELPHKHFLPIDHHLHGAEASLPEVRAVVHVHGARVPAASDGYPETWYTPGNSRTSFYPNHQDGAMLWYHDHTMGINRLNIFAGLFGVYVVRDRFERELSLPGGEYEIPLVLCDRAFDQAGQLDYPVSSRQGAPWIPEFAGGAFLVNGKLLPFAEVEARKYRLRILNASNARFFNLSLENGQELEQIGSDQGLLPKAVAMKVVRLAPGERADVIVDFARCRGERIVVRNDLLPLIQFRVSKTGSTERGVIPQVLRPVDRIGESEAVRTRILSLDEVRNDFGEVEAALLNNRHWHEPVTERPTIDTVEIWSFVNTTDDTHPIHLHLVRFQLLDRRPFDLYTYQLTNILEYTGPAVPPEAGEVGWKDTIRAFAQMVTRIIVRFEGYPGRYVWHCHILEHEDNDMMRPFDVVPASAKPAR